MTETKQTVYPRLGHAFALFGFFIFFSLILSALILVIQFVFPRLYNIGQNSWVLLASYCIPLILTIWIGFAVKRKREGGFHWQFNAIPAPFYLIIPILTLAIYFILDPLVELMPMPDFFIQMMEQLLGKQDIASFLMIVVAAALLEEFLCRGLILDGLLKIYSPRKAIIWSAFLFGLLHLNPWQFVPAFFLGLFMGWLFYKTGSIIPTMLIHATANGFGYLSGFFIPEDKLMITTRDLVGNDFIYALIIIGCIVVLWVGIRWINENYFKAAVKTEQNTLQAS